PRCARKPLRVPRRATPMQVGGTAVRGPGVGVAAAAVLVRPRGTVAGGFVSAQPTGLLGAIGARSDLEEVVLYTGLLVEPFAFLTNPGVRLVSFFFGPIERMARTMGGRVEFLAADFHGIERLGPPPKPRVMLAATTPPDAEGWANVG